jgi:hypothetical protein
MEGISLYNLIILVRKKVKDLIEVKRHNFNRGSVEPRRYGSLSGFYQF